MNNLRLRFAFCLSLIVLLTAARAVAQDYPVRPIRFVVQASAGGQTDIMARIVGQKLSQSWGQAVIVENRPGAGGTIAMDYVAKSPPDGYTLGTAAMNTHGAATGLYPNLPYDAIRDFAPVVYAVSTVSVLSVHPAVPVHSLKELLALARAKPGELTYASGGPGTSSHLFMELLKMETKVDILHIPYKGSTPALADVMAGQVSIVFDPMPSSLPLIKAGKLRALTVSSGKRSPILPGVPTTIEAGVPGYDYLSWLSFVAPAGTPQPIILKLNAEINRILREPEVKEKLNSLGMDPVGGTPEELGAHIRKQVEVWTKVIKASGAKAN
jgi:tripartite-type tricarboxylate transporter receptor subunit TctC